MQQIRRFGDGNPPTSQFSAHIAARMLQNTRLRRSSTFCNAFHCQKTSIPSQTNNSKPRVPYTCRRKIESHPFWLAPRVVLALATFHHASHCQKTSIPPQANNSKPRVPYTCRRKIESHPSGLFFAWCLLCCTFHHAFGCKKHPPGSRDLESVLQLRILLEAFSAGKSWPRTELQSHSGSARRWSNDHELLCKHAWNLCNFRTRNVVTEDAQTAYGRSCLRRFCTGVHMCLQYAGRDKS